MERRNLIVLVLAIGLILAGIITGRSVNFEEVGRTYGYLGIFAVSLVSCTSMVFPIPYLPALIDLSATTSLDPLWIGISGGIGASLGEFSGYILGKSGAMTFPDSLRKRIEWSRDFFQKYGFWAIILVNLTPLPVGALYFVAGITGYSIFKIFIGGIIGKITLVCTMAYLGNQLHIPTHEIGFGIVGIILSILIIFLLLGGMESLKNKFFSLTDKTK